MPLPKRPQLPAKAKAPDVAAKSDDSRFSNFQTDPKFRLPSKKHLKTKLDSRFSRLLTDPDFYSKASVDRYGRRRDRDAGRKELEKLYHVDREEQADGQVSKDETSRRRDRAAGKELAKAGIRSKDADLIRNGGLTSSSGESSGDEEEVEVEEQAELVGQDSEVPMGEVSSRLAAVNMDWDNIRAMDIMAVASSFVPADGRILSVVVYPSEFGRERMEREEIEGPPREIFASTFAQDKGNLITLDGSSGDEDSDDEEIKRDLLKESNDEEFDSKALRTYQLDRLRYYYAIITCSSPNVAKSLYDNMDGREYLSSANFFDLRFVLDETTFDEDAHDKCEELADGYRPSEFSTDALNHSKVKLTWDADNTARQEVQKRAFSRRELDENELRAYIGSDSEDGVAIGQPDKAAILRAALGLESSETVPASYSSKRDRDFKKPTGEMEVTFSAALSANAPKESVFENEPVCEESTIDKYVRQQRERKRRRKERAKALKGGRDPDAVDAKAPEEKQADEGDDPWDDPFFNADPEDSKPPKLEPRKSRQAKEHEEREQKEREQAAERADLELLMVEDDGSKVQHFDMNEIMKAEKAKRERKKGKKKAKIDTAAIEDDFEINMSDPRFARLFESHEFAIDPTNPRYKGTTGMKALLEESRKKRKRDRGGDEDPRPKKEKKDAVAEKTDDLKKLAAKVKAKSKKA